MAMETFEIRSLADDDRAEELVSFNTGIHGPPEGVFRRYIQLDPNTSRPDFHKFIVHSDRIVSATSLLPHALGWHGTSISTGEIGLVGTLKEYRRKGLSSHLMEHWLEFMHSNGIVLSFLWGIPNFYEKFHFYYAFPHVATPYVSLPRSCSEGWQSTVPTRDATVDDVSRISELYLTYNSGITGCEIRNHSQWEWIYELTTGKSRGRWLITTDNSAYALIAGDRPTVWETAAESGSALKNLVLGIFKEYPDLGILEFRHHPDMPVGRWLYRWGAWVSSPEDIWKGTWGGMVRLVDPLELLCRMAPKLQSRLSESKFFKFTGAVPFNSEVGGGVIDIHDGEVAIEPLTGKAEYVIPASILTPIMTGYRGFERFREDMADLPDRVADLLAVIFPRDVVYSYALGFVNEHFEHT
jgi:GNAT superfamily N-acetyltransferase